MARKRSANKTPSPLPASNFRVSVLWPLLGLGVLLLIVYAHSFAAGLIFDSDTIIRQDPRLRTVDFQNIADIFTHSYWWPSHESNVFRPLTTLTYLFNYAVLGNGEQVLGYHVVNFLLHWANAGLVFILLQRLSGRRDVALLAAGVFAVHPVNTEAVTNVVGRADLLAGLAILFGGWCYMRAVEVRGRRGLWLTLMGIAGCLGVIAKENAVMLLAFVALYDLLWRFPLKRTGSWRDTLKQAAMEFGGSYAALLPMLILIVWIRRWMSASTPMFGEYFVDNPLLAATPGQRLLTALYVAGRSLALLVFPKTLSGDYSFNEIPLHGTPGAASTGAVISIAVLLAMLAAALYWRRRRFFAWSILFLLVMMLPTANLLLPIGSIMAERFLYVPSIGFCALAAFGICRGRDWILSSSLAPSFKTVACWSLPILAIFTLGVRTYVRNFDWQSDVSFWKSTVAAAPGSFKAHMTYGDVLWAEAQKKNEPLENAVDRTLVEEEAAAAIVKDVPLKWGNKIIYTHLANYYDVKAGFLEAAGKRDDAVAYYRRSLDVLARARALDQVNNETWHDFKLNHGVRPEDIADGGTPLVYQLLGATYAKLGRWEDCVESGRYLEHIAPDLPAGYQISGTAFFNLKRYDEAAIHFIAGFLVDPTQSDWGTNLTLTYQALGVQPVPLSVQNQSVSLDTANPAVRERLNKASALVVRLFQEARQGDEARSLQARFAGQYGVPQH